MIQTDLLAYLKAQCPTAANRVYHSHLPQTVTLPALTYQVIDQPRELSHNGPTGLAMPNIQVDTWAALPSTAATLAREVRLALDGYQGTMGSTRVDYSHVTDGESYEPETGFYRVISNVVMTYHES